MKTELCKTMTKYGSDKGNNIQHDYTIYYHSIFYEQKNSPLNIFELGLGTNNLRIPSNMGPNGQPGASLRGWRDYFPNANIFGADIDRSILFEDVRIKTFYCDQTNINDIQRLWRDPILSELIFDIIIDDGLHTFDANWFF